MKKLILMISLIVCTISANAADKHAWTATHDGILLTSSGLVFGSMLGFVKDEEGIDFSVYIEGEFAAKGEKVYIKELTISGEKGDIGGWEKTHAYASDGGDIIFRGAIGNDLIDAIADSEIVNVTIVFYDKSKLDRAFTTSGLKKLLVTFRD